MMKCLKNMLRPILRTLAATAVLFFSAGCVSQTHREVVVYVAVDQVHAEPVLKSFENSSGIRVRAVYDVEASKTTGLVQRLIAEKQRPVADVFWNGEFVQTVHLMRRNVVASYAPCGGRARVLLYRPSAVPNSKLPRSLSELASTGLPPARIGLALPLFGSSATHAAALYASLGAPGARALYQALANRGFRIVDGNSVVRDLVAGGQLDLGVTDSDDACGALERHPELRIAPLDDAVVIPQTVAIVAGAPHPDMAGQLSKYLTGREAQRALMASGFVQLLQEDPAFRAACVAALPVPANPPALESVADQFEAGQADLRELFVRTR